MKRLLIILGTAMLLVACGNDEEVKVDNEPIENVSDPVEESQEAKDKVKQDKASAEQKKKDKPKENTIKVDEELELRNLNFGIQSLTIEDDKVTVPFWWNHWASNEKIHLSVLAYPVVKQGDEELEMIGGEDSLLRQTAKGVDSRVEVEYQLIDDETPITITMKTTSDDPEEDSITVDIK